MHPFSIKTEDKISHPVYYSDGLIEGLNDHPSWAHAHGGLQHQRPLTTSLSHFKN